MTKFLAALALCTVTAAPIPMAIVNAPEPPVDFTAYQAALDAYNASSDAYKAATATRDAAHAAYLDAMAALEDAQSDMDRAQQDVNLALDEMLAEGQLVGISPTPIE